MEREQFKVLVKAMKAVYAQPTFIPDQDAFNVWFALLRDAGMIAVVLRHLANEIESKNVGAKELAEWLEENVTKPPLTEKQAVKKPNMQ